MLRWPRRKSSAGYTPAGPAASLELPRRRRSWGLLAARRGDYLALIPPEAFERDYLELRGLPQRYLLLNDPAAIQHVLHNRADRYSRSLLLQRMFRRTLGASLITTEDDAWRNHRHVMAPPFTPRNIRRHAAAIRGQWRTSSLLGRIWTTALQLIWSQPCDGSRLRSFAALCSRPPRPT